MKMSILVAAIAALALHVQVSATEKLAREKMCMGCHAIKEEGAAPSFQRIAAAWKGRSNAEASITRTIVQGSSATGGPHWGKATMPDQAERPPVSEAEGREIARWLLAQ